MSHPPWEMGAETYGSSAQTNSAIKKLGALPPVPRHTDKGGIVYTPSVDTADRSSSQAPPAYAVPTKAGTPSIASAPSPAGSDMSLPLAQQPLYATPDRADVATSVSETAAFVKAAASAAGTGHQSRDDHGDDHGADDGTADAGTDGRPASTVGTADDDDTGNDTGNDTDGDGDGDGDDFGDLEDLLADDNDFDLSEFLELTDNMAPSRTGMSKLLSDNDDHFDPEASDYAEVDAFFNDPPVDGALQMDESNNPLAPAPSAASAASEAGAGSSGEAHEAAQTVRGSRDPGPSLAKIDGGAGAGISTAGEATAAAPKLLPPASDAVVRRAKSGETGDPGISVPFNVNISWRRQSRMATDVPSYDDDDDFADDTAAGYEEADELQRQANLKSRIAKLSGHDMISRLCTKLVLEGDLNKIIRITRMRKKAVAKERRYILLDSTLLWAAYANRTGQKLVLKGRLDIGEYSIFDLPDGMPQGKISVTNAFAVNSLAKNKVNVVIAHDALEKLQWLEAFRKLGVAVKMCQMPDSA